MFSELEEGALYIVLVRAATRQGHGPWSEHLSIQTAKDMLRAPMGLKAAATSEQSVEVWWEPSVARTKVTGYQVHIIVKSFLHHRISVRSHQFINFQPSQKTSF